MDGGRQRYISHRLTSENGSFARLVQAAQYTFTPKTALMSYVRGVENLRKQSEVYEKEGDIETAVVLLIRCSRCVEFRGSLKLHRTLKRRPHFNRLALEDIPRHPDFAKADHATKKQVYRTSKLALEGLKRLKPGINRRYEEYQAKRFDDATSSFVKASLSPAMAVASTASLPQSRPTPTGASSSSSSPPSLPRPASTSSRCDDARRHDTDLSSDFRANATIDSRPLSISSMPQSQPPRNLSSSDLHPTAQRPLSHSTSPRHPYHTSSPFHLSSPSQPNAYLPSEQQSQSQPSHSAHSSSPFATPFIPYLSPEVSSNAFFISPHPNQPIRYPPLRTGSASLPLQSTPSRTGAALSQRSPYSGLGSPLPPHHTPHYPAISREPRTGPPQRPDKIPIATPTHPSKPARTLDYGPLGKTYT